MEVVDDLALAQLVWQAGGKLDVYWGRECLGVEWYPSMGELIRGLEKNLFAGAQYQYWRALLGIIGILFVAVAPWLSIFSGNWLLSLTAVELFQDIGSLGFPEIRLKGSGGWRGSSVHYFFS